MEKLNPMIRPSNVKVAVTARSRSWRASSSRGCRLRNAAPIPAESHSRTKENNRTRSGDLIRLCIPFTLVSCSCHSGIYPTLAGMNRVGMCGQILVLTRGSAHPGFGPRALAQRRKRLYVADSVSDACWIRGFDVRKPPSPGNFVQHHLPEESNGGLEQLCIPLLQQGHAATRNVVIPGHNLELAFFH